MLMNRIIIRRRRLALLVLLLPSTFCVLWLLYQSSTWSNSLPVPVPGTDNHPLKFAIQQSRDPKEKNFDDIKLRDRWLRYHPPEQSGVQILGKRFEFGDHHPKWISEDYVTLTSHSVQDFVIATAASMPFYTFAVSAIETVQRHLPNHRIIVYDLEPRDNPVIEEKFGDVCGVTYRSFNYTQYPPHVKSLAFYAWKPLIITELLSEFTGVFWIDSSIRLTTGDFTVIYQRALASDGLLTLTSTGHSNYAVTHSQTYEYLPTSMEAMIAKDQHEANCVLVYRTRPAIENVLWWWKLCALEPQCIAPTTERHCREPYRSRKTWAQCHRFDQSALNILLANYFAFDSMKYFGSFRVSQVLRNTVSRGKIRLCRHSEVTYEDIARYFSTRS